MKTTLTALCALMILGSGQAMANSSYSEGSGPESRAPKNIQLLDFQPTNAIGDGAELATRHYYDRTCQCDVTEIIDRSAGAVVRTMRSSN